MDKKEYMKLYRKSPQGKKSNTISKWKFLGLKDDYEKVYTKYQKAETCSACKKPFGTKGDGTGSFKCMDHNHATGRFRSIRCSNCNKNYERLQSKAKKASNPNPPPKAKSSCKCSS